MARVLVTGAMGFAGGYLVAHLRAEGHDVWAAAHGAPRSKGIPGADRTVSFDVRDRDAVHRTVAEVMPDEVYHLAGLAHPAAHGSAALAETNVLGSLNVLTAAREAGAAVLAVSSGYVYGPVEEPVGEGAPLRPIEFYGASKAAMEMLAMAEAVDGGDVVVARPFNHSGPGQPPSYLLPTLVHQAVEIEAGEREPFFELGNLDSARDFSDVRDVVKAYALLLRGAPRGQAFNVCTGRTVSVRDLAREVAAAAGIDVEVVSRAGRRRPTDIPFLAGDPSAIRSAVGWRPSIDLAQTLRDMIEHERARRRGGGGGDQRA